MKTVLLLTIALAGCGPSLECQHYTVESTTFIAGMGPVAIPIARCEAWQVKGQTE